MRAFLNWRLDAVGGWVVAVLVTLTELPEEADIVFDEVTDV